MAGKKKAKLKKEAKVAPSSRQKQTLNNTTASAEIPLIPVVATTPLDEATTRNAQKLAGHKGNVLLEDVKPGQRVFLNATYILGQPFLYEPPVTHLKMVVAKLSSLDMSSGKDVLHAAYAKTQREVQDIQPAQLHPATAKLEEVRHVVKQCSELAVLRQLLFDEPIPLIDMASVKDYDPSKEGEPSNTKARRIGQQPAITGISQPANVSNPTKTTSIDEVLQGVAALRFDDVQEMDWVTVYVDDCVGMHQPIITNGTTMKAMKQRAEELCQQDLSAANTVFSKLSVSCKKTREEIMRLRDMAQIGILQAVKEIHSWSQDCMYWCVLRRMLCNVPIRVSPGRCGVPADAGTQLIPSADGNSLIMYDDREMSK